MEDRDGLKTDSDSFRTLHAGDLPLQQTSSGAGNLSKKIVTTSWVLAIALFVSIVAGLLAFAFLPYRVTLSVDQVKIRHVFEEQIDLKEITGIQERISTKGRRFYYIETTSGSYEVDDAGFLDNGGNLIIERLGLLNQDCTFANAKRVWMRSASDCAAHHDGRVSRASDYENSFFKSWLSLVLCLLGLLASIQSGYVYLHPTEWRIIHMLRSYKISQKEPSIRMIHIVTAYMFFMGLLFLIGAIVVYALF